MTRDPSVQLSRYAIICAVLCFLLRNYLQCLMPAECGRQECDGWAIRVVKVLSLEFTDSGNQDILLRRPGRCEITCVDNLHTEN